MRLVPADDCSSSLAALSLAIWIYLCFARGRFWLGRERDDARASRGRRTPPPVAIVVPARNEADNIAQSVASLLDAGLSGVLARAGRRQQRRRHRRGRARAAAKALGAQIELMVVTGDPLPANWTGKLWAVKQGIAAAEADVRAEIPDAHRRRHRACARHAELARRARRGASGTVLTSLTARWRCENLAERVHIPAFIYFFQMLYPFAWVNTAGSSDGGRGRRLHAGAHRRAARGRRHRRDPGRADRRLRAWRAR